MEAGIDDHLARRRVHRLEVSVTGVGSPEGLVHRIGSALEAPELNLTSADLPRPLHPVFTALAILQLRDANSSALVREEEGVTWRSIIGQEFFYDRLDNRQFPTEGYFLRLVNDLAGLV